MSVARLETADRRRVSLSPYVRSMTGLHATVTLAASRVCDNRRMTVTIASRALGPASAEVIGSIPGPMAEPR